MEVNHKLPLRSHHSPCLSGSSQAPLLAQTNGDNGSELSTPISARSVPFHSPNGNENKHQIHHQHQLLSTPVPPLSAASIHSQTSVFFPPPLPARQSINARHKPQKIVIEASNKSPRLSTDINMNAEHERNRELQHSNSMSPIGQQPNSSGRFASNTSKLTNSSPAKQFAFFPEPHLFAQHQLQSRRTANQPGQSASFNSNHSQISHSSPIIDLANTINGNNTGGWPQHDDSYHLYHEPIDPDDSSQIPSASAMVSKTMTPETSPTVLPRSADRLEHSSHLQQFKASPFCSTNGHLNQDWPFVTTLHKNATNNSPTASSNDPANSSTNISQPLHEVTHKEPRRDVSADIYFCYVTLKSKRANHRSRSYHGPKNANASDQKHQLPYFKDATKNLSSTSVAELPMSPIASASSVLPIHFENHCLRELLETESNYVHALEMIITSFARPLEGYLKRDEHQLIFGHIKYFHHIHSAFQADLKTALVSHNKDMSSCSPSARNTMTNATPSAKQTNSNPTTPTAFSNIPHQFLNVSPLPSPNDKSPSFVKHTPGNSLRISTCFLNIKDKFLKYGEYCATLSRAQALLDELTNKSDVAVHLDRCQQVANEGKFKLRDLLSLPMQRILKYHLLLAQLIKKTDPASDDYQGLKRAYDMMLDLGHYINEVKRDTEAIQIINEIEQSITGLNMPPNTQLTDYGRLVSDGFIRIKTPYDSKQHDTKLKLPHDAKFKQKRYVFVFDKVMLMCKLSGVRGYQYREAIVLNEFELEVNPIMTANEARLSMREKWSYNFNLIRSSDKTTYCFYAKTIEDKKRWVDSIQQAIDNIRPAACRNNETNHDFLMHTFEKASSCDHCGKLLLGLYYQGYRCRNCFTSAHKRCIASVRPCGPTLPPRPHNSSSQSMHDIVTDNHNDEFVQCETANGYANFTLDGQPWYWGRMERDQAQAILKDTSHGTFLVRVSPKHKGSYVISLNYNSHVKHMRIYVSKDNQLYLSQNRYFQSIIELVSWYEKNSLVESFHMLDARLALPYKPAPPKKQNQGQTTVIYDNN